MDEDKSTLKKRIDEISTGINWLESPSNSSIIYMIVHSDTPPSIHFITEKNIEEEHSCIVANNKEQAIKCFNKQKPNSRIIEVFKYQESITSG
ncbi:hypothetical protein N9948_02215 [bacterium]|nr:hypothetical protein [bacterium]